MQISIVLHKLLVIYIIYVRYILQSAHLYFSFPLFPRLQYLQISDNLLLLPRWRHEPLTGRVSIRPDTRLYSYTDLHQCALLLLVLMLCYDVHCMPSLCVRHNLTSILFFMGVKELFMQFLCSYSGLFPQVFHSNLFALKS